VAIGRAFFGTLTYFSLAQLLAGVCHATNHSGAPLALSYDRNQGEGEDMTTKSLIKLIKKGKRESPPVRSEPDLLSDENRWSRAVRSWVNDFQQNASKETLPNFDRLFKDAT
jgi:hypothetical protein